MKKRNRQKKGRLGGETILNQCYIIRKGGVPCDFNSKRGESNKSLIFKNERGGISESGGGGLAILSEGGENSKKKKTVRRKAGWTKKKGGKKGKLKFFDKDRGKSEPYFEKKKKRALYVLKKRETL